MSSQHLRIEWKIWGSEKRKRGTKATNCLNSLTCTQYIPVMIVYWCNQLLFDIWKCVEINLCSFITKLCLLKHVPSKLIYILLELTFMKQLLSRSIQLCWCILSNRLSNMSYLIFICHPTALILVIILSQF